MEELQNLKSFAWHGSKKQKYTVDKWSNDKNCRKLRDSKSRANALLTGPRNLDVTKRFKLIAVDLDKKDNWQEVIDTYKSLGLPQSLTVATPSGGYHIFFWCPKDIPAQNINDDRHCKNFELKGDGSNITAPGSMFDDGLEYKVVRDIPIHRLFPVEAYKLCKYKKPWTPPRILWSSTPSTRDVETYAKYFDEQARRNPRGWQIRCPKHEDRRSSAVLFDSGWLYCSGCGYKEKVVDIYANKH